MTSPSKTPMIKEQDRQLVVEMVKNLLTERPNDPVPYMYAYLKQTKLGITPQCTSNNEIAAIKNMRKKIEYLRTQVVDEYVTDESEPESDESEEEKPKKVAKKQRAGVSAEAYGAHNKQEEWKPIVVPKANDVKQRLRDRLLQAFMFQALDEKSLNIVIDACAEVQFKTGDQIIEQGDPIGDCMYVLESGSLKCTKLYPGKDEPTFLKDYLPGEGFGELALLYNAPRAATIVANVDSAVWRLDRGTFNHIVKASAR